MQDERRLLHWQALCSLAVRYDCARRSGFQLRHRAIDARGMMGYSRVTPNRCVGLLALGHSQVPPTPVRPVRHRSVCFAHLQASEFIYERPAFPDLEYTFKHALTQEVAYHCLVIKRRAVLHVRTAGA